MAEELERRWSKLKLTDEEEQPFVAPVEEQAPPVDGSKKLIGKLISPKPPNIRAMANAFNIVWKTTKGFKISECGEGLFLVDFQSTKDKEKVLRDAPWHYDRNLVILKDMDGVVQFSGIDWKTCEFWVRLIDVPLSWRTSGLITRLASQLGQVTDIDENVSEFSHYVRVRVQINVERPLVRGLKLAGGDKFVLTWMPIRYERLLNFCYRCGILGHTFDDCEVEAEEGEEDNWPYDPKLRATPSKLRAFNCGFQERRYYADSYSKGGVKEPRMPKPARKLFPEDSRGSTEKRSSTLGRQMVQNWEEAVRNKVTPVMFDDVDNLEEELLFIKQQKIINEINLQGAVNGVGIGLVGMQEVGLGEGAVGHGDGGDQAAGNGAVKNPVIPAPGSSPMETDVTVSPFLGQRVGSFEVEPEGQKLGSSREVGRPIKKYKMKNLARGGTVKPNEVAEEKSLGLEGCSLKRGREGNGEEEVGEDEMGTKKLKNAAVNQRVGTGDRSHPSL